MAQNTALPTRGPPGYAPPPPSACSPGPTTRRTPIYPQDVHGVIFPSPPRTASPSPPPAASPPPPAPSARCTHPAAYPGRSAALSPLSAPGPPAHPHPSQAAKAALPLASAAMASCTRPPDEEGDPVARRCEADQEGDPEARRFSPCAAPALS